MTTHEFDELWNQVTALWAGWARKIGRGGALTHVQKQWWRMLRDVPLAAAEEAVSAHWQEAGAKFAPDPTAIAGRCGTTSAKAKTAEELAAEKAFYEADRIEQYRILGDAAVRRASRADNPRERDAATAELRVLARYALNMARAAATSAARLPSWPKDTPEMAEKRRQYAAEQARRTAAVAHRLATLARVQITVPAVEAVEGALP